VKSSKCSNVYKVGLRTKLEGHHPTHIHNSPLQLNLPPNYSHQTKLINIKTLSTSQIQLNNRQTNLEMQDLATINAAHAPATQSKPRTSSSSSSHSIKQKIHDFFHEDGVVAEQRRQARALAYMKRSGTREVPARRS
jgi:hypothetical protein